MKCHLTCQYCDHQWTIEIYAYQVKNLVCTRCNDKNIKVRKLDTKSGDVFGYDEDDKKPDAYIKSSEDDEDKFPFGD